MPRCPSCGQTKAASEFPINRAVRSGIGTYCKPCHNRIVRENRQKHHGSTRNFHLRRRYGVSDVEVAWHVLRQGSRCALCRKGEPIHVDHDHVTGQVRGILCFNCNRALGYLDDEVELLYEMADYLERHSKMNDRK